MNEKNLCRWCKYAIPQANSGLGLVDCPVTGYGNTCQTVCNHFRPNPRLSKLADAAEEAIREFEYAKDTATAAEQKKAAVRSCAMQEALAIMLDVSYDDVAEWLRDKEEQDG